MISWSGNFRGEMGYVFIDRRCPHCNGEGCLSCYGSGIVGSFEYAPDIPRNGDKKFGNRLRKTRERSLISISELSIMLNSKLSCISEIELGIVMPTEKQREKLEEWINQNSSA